MPALGSLDRWLLHALVMRRRRSADRLMRVTTRLGDPPVALLTGVVLLSGLVPRLDEVGPLAAWSLLISHLAVQVIKRSFHRSRPALPPGFDRLIEPTDRCSFPSGHAAAGISVGLSFCLALSGPMAAVVLALGLLVGVSRCYLGVHYPFDVVAGWALGVLGVVVTMAWL